MSRIFEHLHNNCPNLLRRMDIDARRGSFDWRWPMHSDRSMNYMSSLLGRTIHHSESVTATMDEVEEKLKNENTNG